MVDMHDARNMITGTEKKHACTVLCAATALVLYQMTHYSLSHAVGALHMVHPC
jgi:hypothetical protein